MNPYILRKTNILGFIFPCVSLYLHFLFLSVLLAAARGKPSAWLPDASGRFNSLQTNSVSLEAFFTGSSETPENKLYT